MNPSPEQPPKYPVLCPWCEVNKGKRTRVGWSTVEGSSGICDECLGDLREEAGMERESADKADDR